MLQQLFAYAIGLFWACIFSLRSLFALITVGPFRYFYINRNAPIPEEINNEKYGEHRIINLGSVKIHYVISGPENGPLMLMLHGFPEFWYSWKHQIMEFQKDFRVVAVDMRGFGDLDNPKGLENYKLNVLVEDVRLLIDALGYKSCVLLCHDWGGGVGWYFAHRYPEMVDRLVAMNMCPVPIWEKVAKSHLKQFLSSGYIFYFFLPYLPEFIFSRDDSNFVHKMFNGKITGMKAAQMSDGELDCYKYYFRRKGAYTAGINYYRANLWPPSFTHALTFPMPVHIIWGVLDPFLTLKLLEETVKAVPHVTVTRFENTSHWVQNDRPVEVNQAVRDFLKASNFEGRK